MRTLRDVVEHRQHDRIGREPRHVRQRVAQITVDACDGFVDRVNLLEGSK